MSDLLALLAWGPAGWGDELAQGLWLTIRLALTTLPFGLAAGLLIALAKQSPEPTLRTAANVYTTIFRGVPELVTLFVIYYGGQIAFAALASLFTDAYVEVSGFVAGVIALGVVFSAFSSEVFLSAFRGIPAGQYEGAQALGLTRFQTLRKVILPQLVRLALPGLSNLWLVLLKDTALVSIIALDDLLRKTNVAVGNTKEPFFFYMVACLIYLALSTSSSALLGVVDRRVRRGEVR
ncbi:ABC transporter permease [Rhizobiaceae bacterium]|nr:ABC transporter permease [Rhizobiaceae bacterium]